jgi:hypothetical protein
MHWSMPRLPGVGATIAWDELRGQFCAAVSLPDSAIEIDIRAAP